MLKKWTVSLPDADFWAGVIMSTTGCALPVPSDIFKTVESLPPTMTITVETGSRSSQFTSTQKA